MRFTMSTDEKKSSDVPSFVIAQPEISPEKKSQKPTIIIAVTSVVVAILVLIAILVGFYIFTEAEKDIIKVTLQLKNNMTQEVSQNPSTNTVQFHVQSKDQEAWIIDNYDNDLKVLKIKSATGTNCYVTPLNESAPTDIPNMKTDSSANTKVIPVSYSTTGTPIKDTSFLGKSARDACSGISTYWLYPNCDGQANTNSPTELPNNRQKRATYYYIWCGAYFPSNYPYTYTCTYQAPYYHFHAVWNYPYTRLSPYYAFMYQCPIFQNNVFSQCFPI